MRNIVLTYGVMCDDHRHMRFADDSTRSTDVPSSSRCRR